MKTLSLDVSTVCTGWAIFDDKKYADSGAWRTPTTKKLKDHFDKLDDIERCLREVKEEHDIGRVLIEAPIISFGKGGGKKGKNNPKTLAVLQKFNGSVSYICYQVFGVKPKHLQFKSCRNKVGVYQMTPGGIKDMVLEWTIKNVPEFKTRITNQGNVAKECFDEADALVLGFGFFS